MSDFDERVQRYIAGELTPEERIAFEDDALSNPEMADRLYADVSMRAAIETAGRARRERAVAAASAVPWWRRRWVQWSAPVLAVSAVAVFVIVQRVEPPDRTPVFRSVDGHLQAIEPQGDVAIVPSQFVWRTADGAAFYRFELLDAASTSVFTAVTADTSVTVDATVATVPAQGYWVVTPLNDLRVGAGDAIITRYNVVE